MNFPQTKKKTNELILKKQNTNELITYNESLKKRYKESLKKKHIMSP